MSRWQALLEHLHRTHAHRGQEEAGNVQCMLLLMHGMKPPGRYSSERNLGHAASSGSEVRFDMAREMHGAALRGRYGTLRGHHSHPGRDAERPSHQEVLPTCRCRSSSSMRSSAACCQEANHSTNRAHCICEIVSVAPETTAQLAWNSS